MQSVVVGTTNWKRFRLVMAGAFAVLVIMVANVITGGLALGVNLSGVGPFTLQFQQLKASQFTLIPNVVGTNGKPVSDVSLNGKIVGLVLSKTVPVPGTSHSITVSITAGTPSNPVQISGLVLDAKDIQSATSNFQSLQVGSSSGRFGLASPAIVLNNANIIGRYLNAGNISLPSLSVSAH